MKENVISEQIQKFRKQMGWSQPQLADKLSVSKQTISNWETGTKTPRMGKIQEMSELFNVKVSEFTDPETKSNQDSELNAILDHAMSFDGKPMTDHDREVIKRLAKTYMETKGDD